MQGKNPTLAKRYLFKLLANVASVPVYLAMEAILPRALGPKMYGSYSFATNLFYQMAGFLDMGTSTCFYNSLSRRQTESGLIAYYMRASLLVLVITMAVAMLFFAVPSCGSLFMPDVPLWLAPLAAFWAFLTWWGRVLRSMNDAIGATVSSEMVRTVVSLVAVVALGGLFFFGLLDIGTLFLQQYCMLGHRVLVCHRALRPRPVASLGHHFHAPHQGAEKSLFPGILRLFQPPFRAGPPGFLHALCRTLAPAVV